MSAPSRSCAILLDALGTLVELEAPWPAFVALMRERHAIEVTEARARSALLVEMDHYRRECVRARDRGSLALLRLECAGVLARELGGATAELPASELARTLLDALHFTAFADVRPALTAWRAQGIRLVVASNWDISLHDVLERLDIRRLVDGVITSAEVGRAKPDGAVFATALACVGVAPAQALHIGDSLSEDVAGARAAGIEAVWLRRGPRPHPPPPPGVRAISSLAEL